MEFLNRLNQFLGRRLPLLILLCVSLGILFPDAVSPLRRCTMLLFACMTFISSMDAGFRDLGSVFLHPLPIVVTLTLLHVAVPLLALLTGRLLFPGNPYLVTGLVLEYSVPTGVMSLMWVSIARGNGPLTLSLVLVDTLISPFVLPLMLRLLVGSSVEMAPLSMMGDLMKMVAVPALLAMTFHQLAGKERTVRIKGVLSPLGRAIPLPITLANASGIAGTVRSMDPGLFLAAFVALSLAVSAFVLGYWAARLLRLDFPGTVSLTLNTGLRNLSAGTVLADRYFPGEVMFPAVVSSLVMQLIASLAVWALQHTKAGRAEQTPPRTAGTS